jgi:hypothetical protein
MPAAFRPVRSVLLLLVWLLVSCAHTAPASTTGAVTPPFTAAPSLAQTSTVTAGLPSPPTLNPTLPSLCPPQNPDLNLEWLVHQEGSFSLSQPILEFLNAGGSFTVAEDAIRRRNPGITGRELILQDLTGDGVPELLLSEEIGIFGIFSIYRCESGKVVRHEPDEFTTFSSAFLVTRIVDANQNGRLEIIGSSVFGRALYIAIVEWDGMDFRFLKTECDLPLGPSTIRLENVDGSPTLELIVDQPVPDWNEYSQGLPWRNETRTCGWDGEKYALQQTIYGPPEYRFQAVQDADRAFQAGDFPAALALWQDAITSDRLEWWSPARRDYMSEQYWIEMGQSGLATPASPPPDPAEHPQLAAYARFRILQMHVQHGDLQAAKVVYDTLQAKFPSGHPGSGFAQMAKLFWEAYGVEGDFAKACAPAADYAVAHAELLAYLGSSWHGWQSLRYTPEDVCSSSASAP